MPVNSIQSIFLSVKYQLNFNYSPDNYELNKDGILKNKINRRHIQLIN